MRAEMKVWPVATQRRIRGIATYGAHRAHLSESPCLWPS